VVDAVPRLVQVQVQVQFRLGHLGVEVIEIAVEQRVDRRRIVEHRPQVVGRQPATDQLHPHDARCYELAHKT
jgi:hypothetical protein